MRNKTIEASTVLKDSAHRGTTANPACEFPEWGTSVSSFCSPSFISFQCSCKIICAAVLSNQTLTWTDLVESSSALARATTTSRRPRDFVFAVNPVPSEHLALLPVIQNNWKALDLLAAPSNSILNHDDPTQECKNAKCKWHF